jgi:hypothetical protein
MLELRVGGDVYGIDDETATELVRRVEGATPETDGGTGTTLGKLRGALDADEPLALDPGDLALVGVELEAWFQETDGGLPSDAEELRLAIARELD